MSNKTAENGGGKRLSGLSMVKLSPELALSKFMLVKPQKKKTNKKKTDNKIR